MRYIIVESFSSFHFAKEKFKKQNICWITSSPKLCNFFFLKKLNFIEIEKLAKKNEVNEIGRLAKEICEIIIFESDKIFKEKKYLDIRYIAGAAILKKIHCIIYKNYLLNKLLNKTKKKIICVGNSELTHNINYLGIEIFDNLFAVIGSLFKNKIKVIEYKDSNSNNKLNILTKGNGNFFLTKIISILNSNWSVFVFKLLKNFAFLRYINNFFYNKYKKNILILRETDHISLSFSKLLKKFNVYFFDENLKDIEIKINNNKNLQLNKHFSRKYNAINNKVIQLFKKSYLKSTQTLNYQKSLSVIIPNIKYLQALENNIPYIEKISKV